MRRITTTMVVALLVTASIVTPAFADAPDGPVHIALGDSVAAGSGANNNDVTAYVPRLNRWLRSVDRVFEWGRIDAHEAVADPALHSPQDIIVIPSDVFTFLIGRV